MGSYSSKNVSTKVDTSQRQNVATDEAFAVGAGATAGQSLYGNVDNIGAGARVYNRQHINKETSAFLIAGEEARARSFEDLSNVYAGLNTVYADLSEQVGSTTESLVDNVSGSGISQISASLKPLMWIGGGFLLLQLIYGMKK